MSEPRGFSEWVQDEGSPLMGLDRDADPVRFTRPLPPDPLRVRVSRYLRNVWRALKGEP